ncbi:MAG: phenylalanine--tRNA ligase beta subunit-related protein [Anaeromicrobium sp.]|jgi:DNA/RNA-binding domain of Phe-tRNA-synthetase-like protein|uniref:B3/B4 domain-containing protein n=1 Tax=Anaeromicrobium sp. TaxID=1929132 RepID=UPI0025CDA7EA|nr:phenylalanine--tRNA ligase beta subunit-related protein [Anaeromicrobium sp.]MCT4594797.1 phenylalanine--tRNA ligase beta subunit-related protein [Anaeromicrobium sp.]
MMNITISNEIKNNIPTMALGIIHGHVKVTQHNDKLWEEIDKACEELKNRLEVKDIGTLPNNKEARDGYRKCKKDPTRYRIASEALIRRVVKDKGLYKVNNVVDINNLLSITSYYPIGCFDMDKIKGNVVMRVGKKNEPYEGIGRGVLNIENMPVVSDDLGAFGSPTSDSERTKITKDTTKILMTILAFGGTKGLKEWNEKAKELFEKYAEGKNIETHIVE